MSGLGIGPKVVPGPKRSGWPWQQRCVRKCVLKLVAKRSRPSLAPRSSPIFLARLPSLPDFGSSEWRQLIEELNRAGKRIVDAAYSVVAKEQEPAAEMFWW